MDVLKLKATLGLDSNEYESKLDGAANKAEDFVGKIGSLMKKLAIAKTLYDIGKGAVDAYAEYEQLVGGVDTLFKSSSKKLQRYAAQAYKTVGMSANQYMSTAISFSSSLINSLKGDTNKAAEQTDKALQDMADNANKMGTSLEMVQNAYRGFARGNFTMLDNLSLGFAGTKSGMQELLDKAQQISGIKYDISSMSDIIDAIHEVQTSMDITGTTAKEAMETIEGSANATKSAWQDVMTAIAGGGDLDKALKGLVSALMGKGGKGGLVNNLKVRILQTIKGIAAFVGKAAPIFVKELPKLLAEIGKSLVMMIPDFIKGVFEAIPNILGGLINGIDEAFLHIVGATVDKTSESYKSIKKMIEAGINGIVMLDTDEDFVYSKINKILSDLQTEEYKGTLVIDGNADAADAAILKLDETIQKLTHEGGSVAELQAAIDECEKLEINPSLSDEQKEAVKLKLDELKTKLDELKTVNIELMPNSQNFLTEAGRIVDTLTTDPKYKGTITINGDPEEAEKALNTIQNNITKILTGEGSIEMLQDAIDACKAFVISPSVDVGRKAEVMSMLNALQHEIDLASGDVIIKYGYAKTENKDEASWNKFKEFVENHGWESKDFTYKVRGAIETEPNTTEDIEKLAGAISAAASAIGNYNEAVDNIKSIAQQQLTQNIALVNQQAQRDLAELATLRNAGIITEEEYQEYGTNILSDAEAQTRKLTEEYDRFAKEAEIYNNGVKVDDYPTALKQYAELYKDAEISEETYQEALANLAKGVEDGGISAKLAYKYLEDKAKETAEMVDKANQDYEAALGGIATQETELGRLKAAKELMEPLEWLAYYMETDTLERFHPRSEYYKNTPRDEIWPAIEEYIKETITSDISDQTGKEYTEEQVTKLVELARSMIYANEGLPFDLDATLGNLYTTMVGDIGNEYDEMIKEQEDKITAAKEEARLAYQDAIDAASKNNEMTADIVATTLSAVNAAGVSTSNSDYIFNTEQTVEDAVETISKAIEKGSEIGAVEMGKSIDEEGAKAATAVGGYLDNEIGKPRTMPVEAAVTGVSTDSEGHATAMSSGEILRGLTPFGIDSNGVVHYGGEAGAEAVVGVNSLDRMIQNSVASAFGKLGAMAGEPVAQPIRVQLVLDSGVLLGEVDVGLNEIAQWRGGGRA